MCDIVDAPPFAALAEIEIWTHRALIPEADNIHSATAVAGDALVDQAGSSRHVRVSVERAAAARDAGLVDPEEEVIQPMAVGLILLARGAQIVVGAHRASVSDPHDVLSAVVAKGLMVFWLNGRENRRGSEASWPPGCGMDHSDHRLSFVRWCLIAQIRPVQGNVPDVENPVAHKFIPNMVEFVSDGEEEDDFCVGPRPAIKCQYKLAARRRPDGVPPVQVWSLPNRSLCEIFASFDVRMQRILLSSVCREWSEILRLCPAGFLALLCERSRVIFVVW